MSFDFLKNIVHWEDEERFAQICESLEDIIREAQGEVFKAFANTIEAIISNVNYLDGTIYGIGRAAGNCPLELLLGFLKNPKFDIRPILELIGRISI